MPRQAPIVAPGDSIAYRQFKENLVVWVQFAGFPWWPGVVKRRKPSDAFLDPELQAMGRSTRPVVFFNDNKSRCVVDINYMREYSSNINLIADSRDFENGRYAKDILLAVEEANNYISTSGTYGFQRRAISRPAFRAIIEDTRKAPGLSRIPDPTATPSRPVRKRTRSDPGEIQESTDLATAADASVNKVTPEAMPIVAPVPKRSRPMRASALRAAAVFNEKASSDADLDADPVSVSAPGPSGSLHKPWIRPRQKTSQMDAPVVSPVTPGAAVDSDSQSAMHQSTGGAIAVRPETSDVVDWSLGEQRQRFREEQCAFNDELARFNEARRRFNADRAIFKTELNSFAVLRKRVHEDREHAEEESESLREDLRRLRSELHVVRERNLRMSDGDMQLEKQIQMLRMEKDRVEEELRKFSADVVALAEDKKQFAEQKPALEAELEQTIKGGNEAKEEMNKNAEILEEIGKEVQKVKEKQRENHDSVRETHTELLNCCKDLKNRRDTLKSEVAALEALPSSGNTTDASGLTKEANEKSMVKSTGNCTGPDDRENAASTATEAFCAEETAPHSVVVESEKDRNYAQGQVNAPDVSV